MTNIRKSFLNKNIIDSLFDGSFWFGENHNYAKIVKGMNDKFEITNDLSEVKVSFFDMGGEKNKKELEIKIEEVNKDIENKILNNPVGYIELYMNNINPDELFIKHNISMQYLTINGNKFIKELRLTNQGRELDCYSEGENKSLTIEKISSTQALLTLEENNGKLEKFIVIKGVIV